MNTIEQNLSKLIRTFNDKRVISEGEIKEVLTAIITILAENKKAVEAVSSELDKETKTQLKEALKYVQGEHKTLLQRIQGDLRLSKSEIDKRVKEQNDRAFKRLQTLLNSVKIPKDGKDGMPGKDGVGIPGKDGSPDTAEQVRDKLETLQDDERLDASFIKGLDKFFGTVKHKGKDMLVGGIRFFENLVDVSITVTAKRQNLLAQYNTTNNRWENGVALTVSTTAPSSPQTNDVWIDTN